MGLRHLARQRALQLLYGLEFNRLPFEEGEQEFLGVNAKHRKPWGEFAHELALRTHEDRKRLDKEIAPVLQHWKIERLPLTDRICLRMALCELEHFADIPLRSTLDEYVELARLFGGEDSPKFVNGVLNRFAERYAHKDFERDSKADEAVPQDTAAEEAADRDAGEFPATGPEPTEVTSLPHSENP
jgi:N utilization substance protein B